MDLKCTLEAVDKRIPFHTVEPEQHVEIFGVSYLRVDFPDGGELYLTRFGWNRMPSILPEHWFADKRYANDGYRLPGGTGSVYRLAVPIAHGKNPLNLVVKFSRAGQNVPVYVADELIDALPDEEVRGVVWNSPFEEFGLLWDLRTGRYGARRLKIRTKRPLAIYCPPAEYQDWQLGRDEYVWGRLSREVARGQNALESLRVQLHPARLYVTLFEWVDGMNAEDCANAGQLQQEEMISLSHKVIGDLERKGYRMIDTKPRHFILRPDGKGGVLRRNGKIVYALVDFELLKRTQRYKLCLEYDTKDWVI